MSERLTKKQLKEDPFLEGLQTALAYARDNVAVVIGGGVLFIAAVVLAVRIAGSFAGGTPHGNPEAERALADARTEFSMGRMDEGIAALDEVRAEYHGSDAAREATYTLGAAYYETGDYQKAQATFEEFLRKPLHDELLRDGAKLAIAACKEESGDVEGALTAYKDVWQHGTFAGTQIQGAMSAARLAADQGRTAEARELYQFVVDQHPASPEAESAEFRLLELNS
jgi:predicted negative regulator of RcsB-dependent stress response